MIDLPHGIDPEGTDYNPDDDLEQEGNGYHIAIETGYLAKAWVQYIIISDHSKHLQTTPRHIEAMKYPTFDYAAAIVDEILHHFNVDVWIDHVNPEERLGAEEDHQSA